MSTADKIANVFAKAESAPRLSAEDRVEYDRIAWYQMLVGLPFVHIKMHGSPDLEPGPPRGEGN